MTRTLSFLAMLALALFAGIFLTANIGTQAFGWEWRGRGAGEEIHAAIEANDYSALPAQAQEKIDQEKFSEMTERYTEHEAQKAELEAIVKAGDFNAFVELGKTHKAEKEAEMKTRLEEKLANADDEQKEKINTRVEKMEEKVSERSEPTQEELREKFDEIVTQYNETGELSSKKWSHKKRGHKGMKGNGYDGVKKLGGGHCGEWEKKANYNEA